MRRVRAGLCVVALVSTACSLVTDLNDLASGGADAVADSALDSAPDSALPLGCPTLDASACAPATLPEGWSYTLVASPDASCPSEYASASLAYDLGLGVGACACGCSTTGAYSCAGSISIGSGTATCTGITKSFDAGDDAACFPTVFNDPHLLVGSLPAPSGSPTCNTNVTGNKAWTSSTETACVPSCAADYCAAAAPFRRCVVSETNAACPAPFTQAMPSAGVASNVTVDCEQCACGIPPPGKCTAKGLAYSTNDCSGTPILNSDAGIYENGICYNFGASVNSVSYAPTVPQPTCTITGGGDGSVAFANPLTICCLP